MAARSRSRRIDRFAAGTAANLGEDSCLVAFGSRSTRPSSAPERTARRRCTARVPIVTSGLARERLLDQIGERRCVGEVQRDGIRQIPAGVLQRGRVVARFVHHAGGQRGVPDLQRREQPLGEATVRDTIGRIRRPSAERNARRAAKSAARATAASRDFERPLARCPGTLRGEALGRPEQPGRRQMRGDAP